MGEHMVYSTAGTSGGCHAVRVTQGLNLPLDVRACASGCARRDLSCELSGEGRKVADRAVPCGGVSGVPPDQAQRFCITKT